MFSFSQVLGASSFDLNVGANGGVTGSLGGSAPLSFGIGPNSIFIDGIPGVRSGSAPGIQIPSDGPITSPGGTLTTGADRTRIEFPNGFLSTRLGGTVLEVPGAVLSVTNGGVMLNGGQVAAVRESSGVNANFLGGLLNVSPNGSGEVSFPGGGVTFRSDGAITFPGGLITYGSGGTTIDIPFFSGVF